VCVCVCKAGAGTRKGAEHRCDGSWGLACGM